MAYLLFAAPLPSITRTRTLEASPLGALIRTRTAERPLLTSFPQRLDWPIQTPTKTISGVIYNVGGTPAVGATVKLFRQMDDYLAATTTAGTGGVYIFNRDADDPYTYYVMAYTGATSPQVHGTSDRGQVPA